MKKEYIVTELYQDIWDMTQNELKDFHIALCMNMLVSMQRICDRDITLEFLDKHKELSKKIIEISKNE